MFENLPSIQEMVIMTTAFLIGLTVHEFAHARAALHAGDDTAKEAGRVTLDPLAHLDPVGTIFFVLTMLGGFGIAWGKPVPIDVLKFKNPRWDNLKVSLWGPLSNIILAFILGLLFRAINDKIPENYAILLFFIVQFNIVLAFFNLIPIAPLDGSDILTSLLPIELAQKYNQFMARYGFILFLIIIFTGVLPYIIGPPVAVFTYLFTGV